MGYDSGKMPMACHLSGDFTPCAECAKDHIGLVEIDESDMPVRAWLVKKTAFEKLKMDEKLKESIQKTGCAIIEHAVAEKLGLYKE